ncbi:FAT1_2_3 [Mytilus edulis]|uniref:FAT1_2_3 n=1 Tax=Mytilus edulis TaxID=6550 RepID=A0A8S3VEI0_MYTED|nr:FAT1_2_3 [Mytilus edulis]
MNGIHDHGVCESIRQCPNNRVIGENTPKDKDRRVDTETGLSILGIANDNQYRIDCCGFVKEWKFYAKTNTGELRLQVWRPGTSPSYSLVGENIVNVANAELDTTVTKSIANSADWIAVQNGDILGWYTPGSPMVTYDNGQQVRRVTGSVSSPYDWVDVPQTTGRDYGLHAVLSPGNSPSITNLATTLTLNYNDDVATNTLVITLTVSDAVISDTLTTTMTTSTAYFTFSSTTYASAGDFVTCEVTGASTPADANTKYFIKFISGTAEYGIFVKDQPGLEYDTANLYNLVIECTDTKDEDTKGFTVYITRNQQPSFDNLQTGLITTSTTNTIDYESFTDKTADITVTVSDGQESDSELIQITVTNVNEAPVFIQNSYSISGNEGLAGSIIGIPSFEVNDPDADALLYSIDCTEFSIGASTGQISLAADYDTDAASITTSTTIQCNVNVSDGVLQDTATLQVTLSNINDNTPIFSKDNYAFYANANDNIGKILTGDVLAATDGDAGVYGTTTFSLDQTGLGKNYFEVSDSGDIYLIQSLNPDFYAGTALSFTATVTDSEGLTDTAGIAVIVSEYTTTTPSTTTDRFNYVLEDSKNVAWFTFLMLILLALLGLLLFWILTGVNWTKLLGACKRRPKRKWKWNPMVERDPGRRLPPPPPPPKPQYIPPPTPPKIKPSGIKWEYWTDQDFSTGNLG